MEFDFNRYFDYSTLKIGEEDNLLNTEEFENYLKILRADNLYVIYASDYSMMRDRFDEVMANENPTDDYFVGKLVEVVKYSFTPFRVQLTDGGVIDCDEIYVLDEDFIKGKKNNATEKLIIETETKQDIPKETKRLVIERYNDTVEVLILPNKDGKGYQYINLTKGHICPCVFQTMEDALKDLERFQNLEKIKSWIELPYGWRK